jgi:DNA-binding CsgD family transcriptional regulator
MANPEQDARSGHGRYIASLTTAEKDRECAKLRTRGLSYQAIADHMGMALSSAHDAVGRALKDARAEAGTELRTMMLDRLHEELLRLDEYEATVREVLARKHVTVSNGRVVSLPDPETGKDVPLEDDGVVLQAIDRLVKIGEERRKNNESVRKLMGADAPTSLSIGGSLKYEIVGVSPEDLK